MKQGNLRNCSKLRNSLLGSGELASLAYGSFKELYHIEVMVLRTWEHGFLSIPGDLWPVFQCFRPLGTCFAWIFDSVWALVLWYTGRRFYGILDAVFALFVLGPYFRPRRNVALHLYAV
jgi:hypothetical protein